MTDRSSRPHHSPRRTPTRRERRIVKVRVLRRWGPARIGFLLRIAPSTVHKVLTRFGLARLTHLDRATGRVVRRYEHDQPGDMVHVDIKKLGNIPDGGGHKVHGRAAGSRKSTRSSAVPNNRPGEPPTFRKPDPIRSGPEWGMINAGTAKEVQSGVQGRGRENG